MDDRSKIPSVDISRLIEITKNCELFKKLNEEQGNDKIHIACCKAMKIETHNPGDVIVKYGDASYDFYVIIEGRVGVRVPFLRGRTMTGNENGYEIFKSREQTENPSNFKFDLKDKKIGTALLNKFINFDKNAMEETTSLGSGEFFGELAIISDKPRAATVTAKTKVTVGILSKETFQKLLGSFTEKRLNEKIEFLQSLPIFKYWSRPFLLKISFYFSLKRIH